MKKKSVELDVDFIGGQDKLTKEEEELGLDITQHGESYQTLRIDL